MPSMMIVAADTDFIAFKQRMERDPELLPSAEVQLELKEQEKKAVTGRSASNTLRWQSLAWNLIFSPQPCVAASQDSIPQAVFSQKYACAADSTVRAKVTPLMQFLHDKHSLKPEKRATIIVPVKKVCLICAPLCCC